MVDDKTAGMLWGGEGAGSCSGCDARRRIDCLCSPGERAARDAQAELVAVRADLDETRLALSVATQALDHLRDGTLREVRRALCCVPDEDVVKAAQRTMEGFDRAVRVASRLADQRDEARAWAVAAMTRVAHVADAMPERVPAPGDVLSAEDFGTGEAGALRLAAFLADGPRCAKVSAEVQTRHGVAVASWYLYGDDVSFLDLARRAPLTVIAWPAGGES
jgi:hypothetical protein